jgi:hypothetical protein
MRTTKTETEAKTETIDTAKLKDVTGGCGACGNPGGVCQLPRQNQSWEQVSQVQPR